MQWLHVQVRMASEQGEAAHVAHSGVPWARSSGHIAPYTRAFKVVGEGGAAGWGGEGAGSVTGCQGQREVAQHVGTLVRRPGVNGSAIWVRADLPDAEMRRLLLAASTNLNLSAVTLT